MTEQALLEIEDLHVRAAGDRRSRDEAAGKRLEPDEAAQSVLPGHSQGLDPSQSLAYEKKPSSERTTHLPREGEILHGIDLEIGKGELHVVMGPNGCGKSTLAATLMGSPEYEVSAGKMIFQGSDITGWGPDERGRVGIFLGFQQPEEIQGVPVVQFLRQALSARRGMDLSLLELRMSMMEWMTKLGMDSSLADRYLNEGFSGGEKKRNEILQMAILEPDLAILDETDTGLDIDAVRIVARGLADVREARPQMGVVMITHFRRILGELDPDRVHIMIDGQIVDSGGVELATRLEKDGYEAWRT